MARMGDSDRERRLERNFFTSQMMVWNCPRCESPNTHDCQGPDFYIDSTFPKQVVVKKRARKS